MKSKTFVYLGYMVAVGGILITVLAYLYELFLVLFLGFAVIIIGILQVIIVMSIDLFVKDKELEIDKLREMGLTIVTCKNCLKENVFEDQYCIFCGESLGSDKDELQEEHKT